MFPLTILILFSMSSMALTSILGSEYDVTSGCDVKYSNVLEILTTSRSITECCGQCSMNDACYSVKYDLDNSICQLNSERNPVLSTNCRVRFRYAELTKRRMDEYCTQDDECLVRDSQCYRKKCLCKIGYSYSASTQSCVESCSAYGSSFAVYRGYKFNGPDDEKVQNALKGTHCERACVRETSFVCRSLEYVPSEQYCILLRATALTNPEHLERQSDTDYYHRNCQ